MVRWFALVLLCGCAGEEEVVDEGFSEVSTLRAPGSDTCTQDSYWPAGLYPLIVDEIITPEPPYEITHIGALLYESTGAFSGRDCAFDAGLHVVVWASDGGAVDVEISEDKTFDLVPLADAYVTAVGNGEFGWGSVELEEPVRVEQGTRLWIGMDAGGDTGAGPGACLGGCGTGGVDVYRAGEPDYAWNATQDGLPAFQLTIAHD